MEGCFICKLSINDGRATVTLREKGARNINEFSKLRNDTKVAKSGDVVHQDCRRDYTNAKSVKQKELDYKTTENRVLRSQEQFNYRDNCLFCGQFADVKDKRKGTDVFPVRTKDFQSNIEKICRERNDEWATHVLTRIVFVHDLHAADAVYHQRCSVNFRTGKSIPSGTPKQSKNKTGRPQHQQAQAAFQKTVEYLLQNEDEQLTVIELVEKMKDYCGDAAYSTVHMKSKIQKYFGDDVIITEINGKPNVITLRKTATSILHDFHQKQNASDPESEKMNIIKAAASLIKSDIKSKIGTKTEYPSVSDVESLECNEHYLPDSLRLFLNSLISTCNHSLKLSAIGQTIIQATRPRSLIAPLQIGLAVQMHHHFGSRFLIDSLYNMGFSSSYSEVQRYEMNAAMSQGTDIPEVTEEGNLQYIADNVDHNLRTIDGHGTFHGMGIIASVTPGFMRTNCIPRTDVNIEELKEIGKIDIRPYKLDKETHTSLKFMKLNQVNATSYSESLSLLSRTVWPIKSTGWSALCQMVYDGVFLSRCSSVKDIVNCGVQIIAYLYGGVPHESLDIIRYRKFANKVLSNSVTFLQVQTLPPTSAAAEQHCKRVFYQIIEWTEETNLNPLDWGWSITNDRLTPIKTTLPAAPDKLLNIIRCKCKTNCDTRRCTCRKHGLECTIACSECKGHLCTNAEKIVFEEDQNE
ncbi:unnamed protein product [Mytilus edulis]|uniref:Uncharacterized protein n=1 Tax=Mytilus edulis TaxID=6550 RepID=A0A8S3S221_MYTED|nr:unnamed protein product [Mytilus edulis]